MKIVNPFKEKSVSNATGYQYEDDQNIYLKEYKCLEDYYIVKAKGCKPHLMDGEHCRTTSREKLDEECHALDTCLQIIDYIKAQNGHDDWEWE